MASGVVVQFAEEVRAAGGGDGRKRREQWWWCVHEDEGVERIFCSVFGWYRES